jgi:7-cyano-7-deazaguanine reductase
MVGVLGQKVAAPESYAPDVLERIARPSASEITRLGWDIWHAYELSWCVEDSAVHWVGWFGIPADSPATVESKSLKLYLNSLNHHRFSHHSEALETISRDISVRVESEVVLHCLPVSEVSGITEELEGINLPGCTIGAEPETISAKRLAHSPGKGNVVSEHLISHSLRSLCPVTAQPDWGSLSIRYTGQPIDHASVSAYLSAYRSHQGFHEQCVDQIYTDLMTLAPASLQVVAFYQRRGGVDITPWRSTEPLSPDPQRLGRQ